MKKFEEEFNYLIELSGKVLTGQIEAEKFETHRAIFLNKYAEKQKPEIPEFVATEIEEKNRRFSNFHKTADITHYVKDVRNWYYEKPYHAELFYRAVLDCYTVKEKRFYLKNKLTGQRLIRLLEENGGGFLECVTSTDKERMQFTQSEIGSMETGSYEQIPVEGE
jgi:hypothetical protein